MNEWLTNYDKLSHVGQVLYECFKSKLTGQISRAEYYKFVVDFHPKECITMMNCLREYNTAHVVLFVGSINATRQKYYDKDIDMLSDAVSIPGITITYVMNKALKVKDKNSSDLYAPGQPCTHKCEPNCNTNNCPACKIIQTECKTCPKNKAYDLMKTGMTGGPSIIFKRYAKLERVVLDPTNIQTLNVVNLLTVGMPTLYIPV